MRAAKFFFVALACGAALYGLFVIAVVLGMARIPGDGGNSTPDAARDRGELVRIVRHGPFSIEQRKYMAGRKDPSTEFCDYWVTFDGKPVKLDPEDYVNHYNSCRAFLLLEADKPTFVIGSYVNSQGGYVPVVVSVIGGVPNVDRREACVMQSGREGNSQAWKGWAVENGQITLCGREWKVMPSS